MQAEELQQQADISPAGKILLKKCAYRLTTPGLGSEVGATIGMNRQLYMGLFLPLIQSVRHLRAQFTYRHYMKASDMM